MQLKSLTMRRRESYETDPGTFVGELTCSSPNSQVTIKLGPQACQQILEIAGQGIKEAAQEQADFLNSQASLLLADKLVEIAQ